MRIVRSQAARADLIEHYAYLADEAGEAVAERFLRGVEHAVAVIGRQPHIGAPVSSRHPALQGIRKWGITGFDGVLLFYLPRPSEVLIVRVLHRSRDWWGALDIATEFQG